MKNSRVSFIIPTYNAAKQLPICLASIKKQNYPKNLVEIFVVDGRSEDETRKVAKDFGAKVIDNPQRDPESAKSLGIIHSQGEVIVLLDADNEIIKKDWLTVMVKPFLKDPDLFGVESLYFPREHDNIFNAYSMLIHIADPFSRCLAANLRQRNKNGYIEYTIPQGSVYPLGANGFLWNKKVIEGVGLYKPKFEESNFSFFAMEKGFRKFARVPGYGIYHDHISSLGDFISKRLKIGNKFLNRKEEKKRTWLEGVSPIKFVYSIIYCVTFIGPLIEGLIGYLETRNKAWLLHPLMSFISVMTYGIVFLKRKFI
ncbi:MAG: glycosyltransferase [Candidatus Daviesbacteria bacterium]|nr:MAG: glycosyltransferase [Candidatus Daviesbacteria bacterium]